MTTEYSIPGDIVRKSTASLQIKISTAQLNFLYWNLIFWKSAYSGILSISQSPTSQKWSEILWLSGEILT